MHRNVLIAIILTVLLGAGYLASMAINTQVITKLPLGSFGLVFIFLALVAGFIAYTLAIRVENRFVRRLVMVGCLALGLYAGGSAYRAIAIQRLFAAGVTVHDQSLAVIQVKSGSIGLASPYTRTVFYLPTTIAPKSQMDRFDFMNRCARVQIEETAGGDKRIMNTGEPVSEADIGSCPKQ